MKPYARKLWADALRSGNYIQVCDRMIENDDDVGKKCGKGMCVMGVLADVALRDSGLAITYDNWREFSSGNEDPSTRTINWAGLSIDTVQKMISDNDAGRKTFDEFAQYIEENL